MEYKKNTFAFIIVSYNSYDDIVELSKTIDNQYKKPEFVIIVDNASPNGDGKRLRNFSYEKGYYYIHTVSNGGFAYACNQGISEAKKLGATHVGLINPDALLSDLEYFHKIYGVFQDGKYEILGTYVVSEKSGLIEFGGADIGIYTLYPKIRHRGELYSIEKAGKQIEEVGYATGSSLFFSIDLHEKVGPIDESYFMYFEETDYCMRVRNLGYHIGILPYTYIHHKTSSSVGRMSWFYVKYMIMNFARFAWKNGKWCQFPGWLVVYVGFWVPGFLFKYLMSRLGF